MSPRPLPVSLVYGLTAAVCLLVYAPALSGAFLWDDTDWIVDNEALRSWSGLARIWLEPGAVVQYDPLTYTSWWLDVQVWGLTPLAFHVENVLLHAANAVLVWRVLLRLRVPAAALAAALFALHPVQVESVAWIVERKNVLSGCFALLATLAWLRHVEQPRRARHALALLAFTAALLAKTATLVLPAVWVVVTWWRQGRPTAERRWLRALLPFAVLAVAAAAMTVAMERGLGATGHDWSLTVAQRLALAPTLVWTYLGLLVSPGGLCFQYPKPALDTAALVTWLPALALLAVAGYLTHAARRRAWGAAALVALLTAVLALAPVLGLVDFYWMRYAYAADHFVYLAAIGPLAVIAAFAARATARWPRRARLGLAAVVLGAAAAASAARSAVFRDAETLWQATLATNPDAWLALSNLGTLRAARDGADAGVTLQLRALEVYPHAFEANNAVGNWHARHGRFGQARAHLDNALRVRPRDPLTYHNLGALALLQRDLTAARDWLERGLRHAPTNPDLRLALANLLANAPDAAHRDPARALALAREVYAAADPPSALQTYVLFRALLVGGERDEALALAPHAMLRAQAEGLTDMAEQLRQQLERLHR